MSMRLFRTFKSGDLVTKSGQYAALHSTPHALMERALYVEGSRFEECRMCPSGFWPAHGYAPMVIGDGTTAFHHLLQHATAAVEPHFDSGQFQSQEVGDFGRGE